MAQIFELISAQKAVPEFSKTNLRNATNLRKCLTGFSVICDLILGVLSVAQTVQFITAEEIDVPAYFAVLKRVRKARELKLKWIRKGLAAYGAAVAGVFEASVDEFCAPLRTLSIYGPVACDSRIDDRERNGWLRKCK